MDFQILKIFTFDRNYSRILHLYTKFRENRTTCCRVMAKNDACPASVRHLDFKKLNFGQIAFIGETIRFIVPNFGVIGYRDMPTTIFILAAICHLGFALTS